MNICLEQIKHELFGCVHFIKDSGMFIGKNEQSEIQSNY